MPTLGNKERCAKSRDVGPYLGLRPKRSQSGDRDPQLGITKAGNIYLRTLLVECANHVLRPRAKDSALRQWGLSLGARGGAHARRRAVVAVARKLAVLLHRIWVTQETYVPFHAIAAYQRQGSIVVTTPHLGDCARVWATKAGREMAA